MNNYLADFSFGGWAFVRFKYFLEAFTDFFLQRLLPENNKTHG